METVVIWIFVASFLDLFAISLLIPLLSAHLKGLGASHFLMGCMTSIYALAQLISGPVVGSWSDRIGRHKILVICLLIVSCCYAAIGVLESLTLILLVRAILGVFKHVQVLIRTIITDKVSEGKQTLVLGHLKAVAGVSFTLGPAIGGNLAEVENGFTYLCYFVGALYILNCAVVHFFLNDSPSEKSSETISKTSAKKPRIPGGSILDAIRDLANVDWPIYWDVFALKFLMDFSTGAFVNNYSIKIQEKFDITPKTAGYTISFQSFIGVFAGFFVDYVTERFYRDDVNYKKRNFHGYGLMTIGYLGIATTHSLTVFMGWSILVKSAQSFLRIVLTEMLIRRCPANQKGSLIGTGNSVSNTARLITPLFTGFVVDSWGTNGANVLAASAAILGTLVTFRLREDHQKSS